MAGKMNVYEIVTENVLKMLDEDIVPWHKPWTSVGGARNANSKRPYRSLNSLLLGFQPYSSPFWATYNGWQKLGGQVKKGETGQVVTFWKVNEYKDASAKNGVKKVPMLRYYRVFNREQVEGDLKLKEEPQAAEHDPIAEAEAIIDGMVDAPSIGFGGNRASYSPPLDHVQMPPKNSFESTEAYYSTMFHELGHSTGHESRLNREFGLDFGNELYSKEELIAEMTAAMLCGILGIDQQIEASAAYIKHWNSKLQSDPKMIMQAASAAQKAADRIQNISWDKGSASTEEAEKAAEAVAA